MPRSGSLTDVPGVRVGHFTDPVGVTGCTVALCEQGATAAIDVRGGAPATRESDLLRPGNLVQQVHAVLLSGGSAYGLAAAAGVVEYLEERGVGFPTSAGPVPIVPAAALFDLGVGSSAVRPGPRDGYSACRAAATTPVEEGSVGAGTGATVGHLRGIRWSTKGGLGCASRRLASGAVVGALVAVNAFGDVVEPGSGRVLAGTRDEDPTVGFLGTAAHIEELTRRRRFGEHTTLALVATDAALDRAALGRVATMAHDGLARVVNPAHTPYDGDVVYALATGAAPTIDAAIVGTLAAEAIAEAVVRAVTRAGGLGGIPSLGELQA